MGNGTGQKHAQSEWRKVTVGAEFPDGAKIIKGDGVELLVFQPSYYK